MHHDTPQAARTHDTPRQVDHAHAPAATSTANDHAHIPAPNLSDDVQSAHDDDRQRPSEAAENQKPQLTRQKSDVPQPFSYLSFENQIKDVKALKSTKKEPIPVAVDAPRYDW
jgi:hypothetical protein